MQCRILDFNYCTQDNVTVSASSQNPEFPVSNVKRSTRSKVWRGAGNFVIAASNCKIDFLEVEGGPELTATVTSGTYSPATLAAEIAAQMAAAGAKTYSCSFSTTTGKWSIATVDGDHLSLPWQTGTHSASSIGASLGFIGDSAGALSYAAGKIALHTEEWITLDLGSAEEIDSFAMFFDPMRAIPFSAEAEIRIQANATDSWAAPAFNVLLTLDTEFDLLSVFWAQAYQYRYWRILIKDPANANLYVEVSTPILAMATQLTRVQRNGWSPEIEDPSDIERTKHGHEYADVYPQIKRLSLEYAGLSYADIKKLTAIYKRVGRVVPIVIALDPEGTKYDKDHFVLYGKFREAFNPKHLTASYFNYAVTFQESF